ncbi:MAG: type II toxin-antitoxin system VapC family toxin, partial [Acidobacteria bacterium]|nr:type II toxin-antitoxin system VapC family toxin [Acidobacteriota bacterium]
MILVDANILVYAVDSAAPRHRSARAWLERTLSGTTSVGLPWIVIL